MSYKPLLAPGIHNIEVEELDNHFLSCFAGSSTRPKLIAGFKKYVEALKAVGIKFEVWIDGSFATEKSDPNDIDMVIFGSAADLEKLPEPKQAALLRLTDRASVRLTLGCDVLFCVTENQEARSYWRGWYGFDRNENPKGIARLEVTP
jgi:hypothetical protein